MTESSGWPGPWVVEAAQRLAADLLGDTGDRCAHTQGVAARAEQAIPVLPSVQVPTLGDEDGARVLAVATAMVGAAITST